MFSFTKDKRTGDYDVIGPANSMREGETVTVTKKSGQTKQVKLGRVSRPFTAKFGPLKGQQAAIAKVASNGRMSSRERHNAGDKYVGTKYEGAYCGFPCPVTGKKCCPANGPCHDCM